MKKKETKKGRGIMETARATNAKAETTEKTFYPGPYKPVVPTPKRLAVVEGFLKKFQKPVPDSDGKKV